MDNVTRANLFDRLADLAMLSQYNLESQFTKDNTDAICQVATELFGDDFSPEIGSPQEFIVFVYGLRDMYSRLSRRLGDAIIASGESYDKGDKKKAIAIIEEFIKNCPAPFLNEIAQDHKEGYRKEKYKKIPEETKKWGLKAGNTLVLAQEKYEKGGKEVAISLLDAFIKACPIEVYKEDARSLKERIINDTAAIFKKWSEREH